MLSRPVRDTTDHALPFTTLSVKIAGAKVVVTAFELECVECMTENHEEALEMDVSGTGRLRYTGVSINVSGCSVVNGEIKTEALRFTTISTTSPIITEVSPVSGTTVEVIHLSGEKCPLGSSLTVKGHADWTSTGAQVTFATGAEELPRRQTAGHARQQDDSERRFDRR